MLLKKIITPVGLSLFYNFFNDSKNHTLKIQKSQFFDPLNESGTDASKYQKEIRTIKQLKNAVLKSAVSNDNASAEITSIRKIMERVKSDRKDASFEIHLLASDTVLSVLAAEIISEYFHNRIKEANNFGKNLRENSVGLLEKKSKNTKPEIPFIDLKNIVFKHSYILADKSGDMPGYIVKDLRVTEDKTFEEEGLRNLYSILNYIMKNDYKNSILNITGGYKGVIPYLTILGQLKNIPLMYIFEGAENLIEIPQLPVDFDFSAIEENYYAFDALASSKKKFKEIEEFKEDIGTDGDYKALIRKKLIEERDNKIILTTLGEIFWDRYKELFISGKFERQNIIGCLVEMKVFKYYQKKGYKVEHGKKVGAENAKVGYDIDVYIEEDSKTSAIEVKPGNNVPFWEQSVNGRSSHGNESLEYKLREGGFWYLYNQYKEGKRNTLRLKIFLYSHKEIHKSVKEQIRELNDKYPEISENLEWYWVRMKDNYKTNTEWEISEGRIRLINP